MFSAVEALYEHSNFHVIFAFCDIFVIQSRNLFFSTFHFSQFNFLKILVIMPLQC